ncbi:MAG: response regulator [Thermodesulfobacteriota bacterium]|nr:response regulator [Thermodesulfobacteriota bacterium]
MPDNILFVDDEEYIIELARMLFEDRDMNVLTAMDAESALDVVRTNEIAVLISDNLMPGMNGLDLLSRVRTISPDTVKILMTGFADLDTALDAINRVEVFRFVVKPWENRQMVDLVDDALYRYWLIKSLKKGDEGTMLSLVHALELKDPYTKGHSERVAGYAVRIAEQMGLSVNEKREIKYGSWLHDFGKIGVSEAILNQEGPLNDAERHVINNHPSWGAEVARQAGLSDMMVNIILSHHERFDGKGYPNGLKGEDIPLGARIVCVADIYDALTTNRPYRDAYGIDKALELVISMKDNVLDPAVVDAFCAAMKVADSGV